MHIHTAIKAAVLSTVLAGAVMSWGWNGIGSVYASTDASSGAATSSSQNASLSSSTNSTTSPSTNLANHPSSSIAASSSVSSNTNMNTNSNTSPNTGNSIPEDAIRLRILANSDFEEDQAVKREVRDRVVEMMNSWLKEEATPSSREEARALIQKHMEELTAAANEVLQEKGMSYKAKAELKVVPFPAKLYGGEVYPAGNYEALRITLGAGEGQNWWCVLFPPLCFVDSSQGTAVAQEDEEGSKLSSTDDSQVVKADTAAADHATDSAEGSEREVRFFLWDVLVAIGEFFSWLFTAIFG